MDDNNNNVATQLSYNCKGQSKPYFYFIQVSSEDSGNIDIAHEHCIWTSTYKGNAVLEETRKDPSKTVYLCFTIHPSEVFYGIARVDSPPIVYLPQGVHWNQTKKWPLRCFKIEWMYFKTQGVPRPEAMSKLYDCNLISHARAISIIEQFSKASECVSCPDDCLKTTVSNYIKHSDEKYEEILARHKNIWLGTGFSHQTPSKALGILDEQLNAYLSYEYCNDTFQFVTGRGSFTPKVVFLVLNPSPVDISKRSAFYIDDSQNTRFSDSNWIQLLSVKINTILEAKDVYFMYIFPYYLGKERQPSETEMKLFLPYVIQRIQVLNPKVVVSLGSKATKYASVGFDWNRVSFAQSFFKLMEKISTKKEPEKVKLPDNKTEIHIVPTIHPFQLMKGNAEKMSGPTQEKISGPTQENLDNWDAAFKCIDKTVNPYKIRGPKIYDHVTGKYKVDVLAVMKEGATAIKHEEDIAKKKKEGEDKKKGDGGKGDEGKEDEGKEDKDKKEIEKKKTEQVPLAGFTGVPKGPQKSIVQYAVVRKGIDREEELNRLFEKSKEAEVLEKCVVEKRKLDREEILDEIMEDCPDDAWWEVLGIKKYKKAYLKRHKISARVPAKRRTKTQNHKDGKQNKREKAESNFIREDESNRCSACNGLFFDDTTLGIAGLYEYHEHFLCANCFDNTLQMYFPSAKLLKNTN